MTALSPALAAYLEWAAGSVVPRRSVLPVWRGETAFVVAGGPSLLDETLERLRGRRVIAIKTAWRRVPWADVLFFADKKWFDPDGLAAIGPFRGDLVTTADLYATWRPGLALAAGRRVAVEGDGIFVVAEKHCAPPVFVEDHALPDGRRAYRRLLSEADRSRIVQLARPKRTGPLRLCEDPAALSVGWSSTCGAWNLARHLGVSRIVTLGLDNGPVGDRLYAHDKPCAAPQAGAWTNQRADLGSLAADLAAAGIEMLITSRHGADRLPFLTYRSLDACL